MAKVINYVSETLYFCKDAIWRVKSKDYDKIVTDFSDYNYIELEDVQNSNKLFNCFNDDIIVIGEIPFYIFLNQLKPILKRYASLTNQTSLFKEIFKHVDATKKCKTDFIVEFHDTLEIYSSEAEKWLYCGINNPTGMRYLPWNKNLNLNKVMNAKVKITNKMEIFGTLAEQLIKHKLLKNKFASGKKKSNKFMRSAEIFCRLKLSDILYGIFDEMKIYIEHYNDELEDRKKKGKK